LGSVVVLLLAMGMNGGCGATYYDETWYQGPNWTPEGQIYCQKSVTHYRKEPMGTITLGTDYYYVTMDTDGKNEKVLPYNHYPYFSPKGTYVALISEETISIIRRSDNQEVYHYTFPISYGGYLDWGPNEDKLVYKKASTGTLVTMNIDGSNAIEITTDEVHEITWKYGDRIVFFRNQDLTLIKPDGTSVEVISPSGGDYPNFYSNGQYIFTADNQKFYKIDVTSKSIVSELTHQLSDMSKNLGKMWINPKLSPDNQRVVVGILFYSGIWVCNIDGSNLKQLK